MKAVLGNHDSNETATASIGHALPNRFLRSYVAQSSLARLRYESSDVKSSVSCQRAPPWLDGSPNCRNQFGACVGRSAGESPADLLIITRGMTEASASE
ncbi:hypothetical protein [Haladaptatus sp. DFWS20]|uniref:hypothetical protein n=1 Tax=Haladaptatus sp. DFWS20 TaxID=3403467 RepID=UPI003EBC41E6